MKDQSSVCCVTLDSEGFDYGYSLSIELSGRSAGGALSVLRETNSCQTASCCKASETCQIATHVYLYSAKSQTYGREIFQRWILYLRYRFHISEINFIFLRHHVCDLVPVSGLQLLTLLLPLEPSVHLPHLSQRRSPCLVSRPAAVCHEVPQNLSLVILHHLW